MVRMVVSGRGFPGGCGDFGDSSVVVCLCVIRLEKHLFYEGLVS